MGAVLVCCLVCVSGFVSGRFRVWFVGYSGFLDLRLEWVLWYKVGVCCLCVCVVGLEFGFDVGLVVDSVPWVVEVWVGW